jgi:hypothetical protein
MKLKKNSKQKKYKNQKMKNQFDIINKIQDIFKFSATL